MDQNCDHDGDCGYDDANEIRVSSGYYKQGDDFAHFLKRADGNSVEALRGWGASLRKSASGLEELAQALSEEDPSAHGQGCTHVAVISTASAGKIKAMGLRAVAQLVKG